MLHLKHDQYTSIGTLTTPHSSPIIKSPGFTVIRPHIIGMLTSPSPIGFPAFGTNCS